MNIYYSFCGYETFNYHTFCIQFIERVNVLRTQTKIQNTVYELINNIIIVLNICNKCRTSRMD
jgi:hypothetical protein